jgi:hypothetical protein
VAVAVVAVLALVAALFAVFLGDGDGGEDASGEREEVDESPGATADDPGGATTTTEAPATDPADFDAVIADIEAFVEQERGLQFLSDVDVELADDEEFSDRLLADFDEDTDDLVDADDLYTALGLIGPDVDLVASLRELLDVGVVGFYDPETNELVVRGTSTTPYVRQTIAHELTHALQDQHFELDRPALDDADDESAFGFTGLVEGDAEHVADAYAATFTAAEQAEAEAEEIALGLGFDFSAVPFVLLEQLTLPYLLGPELIDAILTAGGQELLDASFAAPPTTSEHIIDPDTFVLGDPPNPVTEPDADGEVTDRGVLGLLGLAELADETAILGADALPDELDGWGGDHYVAWHDGDRTCVRVAVVGELIQDTDEYESLLAEVAQDPPGDVEASVTRGPGELDPVLYTSCG